MNTNKGIPIVFFLITFFSFTVFQNAAITGTISPADAATHAWAIIGKDTFSGSIMENRFQFDKIKPGTYQIVIEASPPYKNGVKNNVIAKENLVTNVGEIILEK